MALARSGDEVSTLPQRVTAALTCALDHLGGEPATPERVGSLAVGDRRFLMRQLAPHLGIPGTWLTAVCAACGTPLDTLIEHAELPAKSAGEGFPYTTATTSVGELHLRAPAGTDQEAIAGIEDEELALRALLSRCLVDTLEGKEEHLASAPAIDDLTAEDLGRIDAALEEVSPEVASAVIAACPDCGEATEVAADPYICLAAGADAVLEDVHALASSYHWSEGEILALSRERRQRYLRLLDRDRGASR